MATSPIVASSYNWWSLLRRDEQWHIPLELLCLGNAGPGGPCPAGVHHMPCIEAILCIPIGEDKPPFCHVELLKHDWKASLDNIFCKNIHLSFILLTQYALINSYFGQILFICYKTTIRLQYNVQCFTRIWNKSLSIVQMLKQQLDRVGNFEGFVEA